MRPSRRDASIWDADEKALIWLVSKVLMMTKS